MKLIDAIYLIGADNTDDTERPHHQFGHRSGHRCHHQHSGLLYAPLAGPSKTEVAARGGRKRFGGSDVVVEERAEVAVAGLRGDPVHRGAVEGGCGPRGASAQ